MELDEQRARVRAMWALGDYRKLAALLLPVAEALVGAVGVRPGERVLDVATGTGNAALAAARAGAQVAGVDLTPRMLELARARGEEEGAEVAWAEGDLEDLPFPDASFDVAVSAFGVIFAPRPARAVDELARVLRPGGRVALASWWNDGYVGGMQAIVREIAAPPPGTPDASAWGQPELLAGLLSGPFASVVTEVRSLPWRFPSAAATAAFWRTYSPGHVAAARRLPPETAQALFDAFERQAAASATPDGTVEVDARWLLTTAVRRA